MYIQLGPIFADDTVSVLLYNGGNTSPDLDTITVTWGEGSRALIAVRWQGQTVWSGTEYNSAYLTDLSGEFPAGSLAQLEFVFESGPITWLSFQVAFDNGCSVAYDDPYQPTPTPTTTPTGTVPPLCDMGIQNGPIFDGNTVRVVLYNDGSSTGLSQIVVMWGSGIHPLIEVDWQGQMIWHGVKYYSAFLSGLSGDFPSGSQRELAFVFESGPINWLSFQARFDNDCFVSYSDPWQPTPPPIPTYTPTRTSTVP